MFLRLDLSQLLSVLIVLLNKAFNLFVLVSGLLLLVDDLLLLSFKMRAFLVFLDISRFRQLLQHLLFLLQMTFDGPGNQVFRFELSLQ